EGVAQENEYRRDEERDLSAGARRDGKRDVETVPPRHLEGAEVLGSVPDERDDHDPDKELAPSQHQQHGVQRSYQQLTTQGGTRGRSSEDADGSAAGPGGTPRQRQAGRSALLSPS